MIPVKPTPHGTLGGYTNHRCRCDDCRAAMHEYRAGPRVDRDALRDLLLDLFPRGLTDECPAATAEVES